MQDTAGQGNIIEKSPLQIQPAFTDNQNSTRPSGLKREMSESYAVSEEPVFYAKSIFTPQTNNGSKTIDLIIPQTIKDEKDSTEIEPKLEPLVVSGTGLALAGLGVAVAGIFGAPILFVVAALLLAGSALVTALGWKKIKAEPKKFKGEKFAIANYIIIGIIGVLSSFYLIWLLFDV